MESRGVVSIFVSQVPMMSHIFLFRFLPNVTKITDQICRLLLKHQVRCISKFLSKISQILPTPEDKLNVTLNTIFHHISCSYGSVLISKTGNSVEFKLFEHKFYLRSYLPKYSVATDHDHQTALQIHFNNASIVARWPHFQLHQIRESF